MELWVYLSNKKRNDPTMTNKKFSSALGIREGTLSRIVRYKQIPGIDLAKKIEKETEGEVVWWELLELCNKSKGYNNE